MTTLLRAATGNDTLDLSGLTDANVTFTSDDKTSGTVEHAGGTITYSGIEFIDFGDGNDPVSLATLATSGDDTITLGSGDDAVDAGAGNDVVYGGAGSDTVQGGAGDDVFGIGDVSEDGGDDDVIEGGAGNDTLDLSGLTNAGGDALTMDDVQFGGGDNSAGTVTHARRHDHV